MKNRKLFISLCIAAVVILVIELILYSITGALGRTAFVSLFGDGPEQQKTKTELTWPKRGKIIDCKGRVIATNRTVWDVHLDCTVLDAPEDEWDSLASDLSKELEVILGEKKAWEYFRMLNNGRAEQKKYLTICKNAEDSVVSALMQAPLLNMGQFDGGAIFESLPARTYPYGPLGRRTIGYVHNGIEIGLEGAYNTLLSGKPGEVKYVRKNKKGHFIWKEKYRIEPIDGIDLTTTLDMDIMTVVDAELRDAIEGCKDVKSACAVLMEAKSGAVRAMVNLMSGADGDTNDEMYNLVIGNEYEPGAILTGLPENILEQGLKDAKFDLEGLRDARYAMDEKGTVNVSCTPLHVLRIIGGIANGGEMFDPYLVTASSSKALCSKSTADSLKNLCSGCNSTAIVPQPPVNGSDSYRYPSGEREFATTWCGYFNSENTEYVLLCSVFSKPTMVNAPQSNIPEHVAKEIMYKLIYQE